MTSGTECPITPPPGFPTELVEQAERLGLRLGPSPEEVEHRDTTTQPDTQPAPSGHGKVGRPRRPCDHEPEWIRQYTRFVRGAERSHFSCRKCKTEYERARYWRMKESA